MARILEFNHAATKNRMTFGKKKTRGGPHAPSRMLLVMEWIRKTFISAKVDLDRLRQMNIPYIEERLAQVKSKYPLQWRRRQEQRRFRGLVIESIRNLFAHNKAWRIDHWELRGKYLGLGLFSTTSSIRKLIAEMDAEPPNAERIYSSATATTHDSIFQHTFSKAISESAEQDEPWLTGMADGRNHYAMPFAIFGALMFVNHGNSGRFCFSKLKIENKEAMGQERMIGKVRLRAKDQNGSIKIGSQIFVQYGGATLYNTILL